MKSFIVMLLATSIFAGAINQKMIISVSKNSFQAEQSLHYLETFFYKQGEFPQIEIKIEKLDEYFLVTLSPVNDIATKHTLFRLLEPKFENIFTVENIAIEDKSKKSVLHTAQKKSAGIEAFSKPMVAKREQVRKAENSSINKLKSVWERLDSDWLALIALAIAGMLLIFRSNYQIGKIKKLQKEIEAIQRENAN